MKKFLLTILAFVYITSSTGASFHMHYCMGKLADFGLIKNTSKTCSKCGMEETGKGCCRHEVKFVKNNSDQKAPETTIQFLQLISTVPHPFITALSNNFPAVTLVNLINQKLPPDSGIACYIRNCVFRI